MDKNELLAIYDRQMRIDLRLPDMVYEKAGRILRDLDLNDPSGFIDYSDLDETCAEAEIDAQVAFFQSQKMPFAWKVFDHDQPADLAQRLAARGFTIDQPGALMVLDLENAPAFYDEMVLPDGIVAVTDTRGIDEIVRLEEEIWQGPRDWLRKRLTHTLESHPERLSLFAVRIDDLMASAAWIQYYPPGQFASLLGGATRPGYRGRGFYTALLVTRAREARQRGYRFLTVDASPMSRPILEKHGFACLGSSRYCRWKPE
jgi:GNAT superfamily N-acetyltransferase